MSRVLCVSDRIHFSTKFQFASLLCSADLPRFVENCMYISVVWKVAASIGSLMRTSWQIFFARLLCCVHCCRQQIAIDFFFYDANRIVDSSRKPDIWVQIVALQCYWLRWWYEDQTTSYCVLHFNCIHAVCGLNSTLMHLVWVNQYCPTRCNVHFEFTSVHTGTGTGTHTSHISPINNVDSKEKIEMESVCLYLIIALTSCHCDLLSTFLSRNQPWTLHTQTCITNILLALRYTRIYSLVSCICIFFLSIGWFSDVRLSIFKCHRSTSAVHLVVSMHLDHRKLLWHRTSGEMEWRNKSIYSFRWRSTCSLSRRPSQRNDFEKKKNSLHISFQWQTRRCNGQSVLSSRYLFAVMIIIIDGLPTHTKTCTNEYTGILYKYIYIVVVVVVVVATHAHLMPLLCKWYVDKIVLNSMHRMCVCVRWKRLH